jgi:hypothetical protein
MGQANRIQALGKSRQVIALSGDGGFNMLMSEFLTAAHHKLPSRSSSTITAHLASPGPQSAQLRSSPLTVFGMPATRHPGHL